MKLIDITGRVYGGLKVLSRHGRDTTGKTTWLCECYCGNQIVAVGLNLKSGNTTNCGKHKPPRRIDISKQTYGRLTAVSVYEVRDHKVYWLCECSCGNRTVVSLGKLRSGKTRSCGCLAREVSQANMLTFRKTLEATSPRYRFDLTDEERKERGIRLGKGKWMRAVFERDGFRCQRCSDTNRIHAHHIVSYSRFKDKRLDISNGITLCQECHRTFHKRYGLINFNRNNLCVFIKEMK
jgi:5-methylcytosine-specific restriction endonuclease McrA